MKDYLAEGKAEGRIEGRAEGRVEGRAEGKTEGQIETMLLLFSQKLGPVPNDIETMIRALKDQERIQTILTRFMDITDWESLKSHLAGS
jgi:predicted transposase YdaD